MVPDPKPAGTSGKVLPTLVFLFVTPLLLVSFRARASAGELALYVLPFAKVEYEGSGFREFDWGWTYKTKPRSPAAGLRWRHDPRRNLAFQLQYWANWADFDDERGNAREDDALRQEASTRITVRNLLADLRFPLAGHSVEGVAGAQGAWTRFERRDIRFRGLEEVEEPTEDLWGAGAYLGFHAGTRPTAPSGRWYWDGEALLGHLFFTGNRQKAEGGSIRSHGFSYLFRLEGGYRLGRWRLGAGYQRQLLQIQAEGGKALDTGAVASLPVNKTDFFGPFLAVSHVY